MSDDQKVLPTPIGVWSSEGQTRTGRWRHSICFGGEVIDGHLSCDDKSDELHICIAEVYGRTEEEAQQRALAIVQAINGAADRFTAGALAMREACAMIVNAHLTVLKEADYQEMGKQLVLEDAIADIRAIDPASVKS